MPIWKANPNADIIYGMAVVQPTPCGPNGSNFLKELDGSVHIANPVGSRLQEFADSHHTKGHWAQENLVVSTPADVATPAANVAAVVTYLAAGIHRNHVLFGIAYSYSGAPTGGYLQVDDSNGNILFKKLITAGGPGFEDFPKGLRPTTINTPLVVTLAAGGAGISGTVTVKGHRVE